MTASAIITLAADVAQSIRHTPFVAGQPVCYSTHTGTPTAYGANLPGPNADNRNVTEGDGSKRSWNVTELPALDGAHDDGGTLTTAATLRVIAFIEGVLQKRVVSTTPLESMSAGEFKILTAGLPAQGALSLLDQPASGNEFGITDVNGVSHIVEFQTGAVFTTGTINCAISAAGGVAGTAANLTLAINSYTGAAIAITAGTPTTTGGTVYRIPVYQDEGGSTGNTTITYSGANLSGTDFAGGTDDGETMLFHTVPPEYAKIDVSVLAATDIDTKCDGAMAANIRYEDTMSDVVIADAACRIEKLYN